MLTLMKRLILSLPLAIGWTIYTAQPTIGNFLLGYLFSFAVLIATGVRGDSFNLRNPPRQLFSLSAYILLLASKVLVSGLQVARLILTPGLPVNPGLSTVNTQDVTESSVISAVSAHGITITPGELVVDFEETTEAGVLMIVHSLNIAESAQNLDSDQTIRLKRIKGILGHD